MTSFYTARKRIFASTLPLALVFLVSACSGGGGGAAPPTTNAGAAVGQTARSSPIAISDGSAVARCHGNADACVRCALAALVNRADGIGPNPF